MTNVPAFKLKDPVFLSNSCNENYCSFELKKGISLMNKSYKIYSEIAVMHLYLKGLRSRFFHLSFSKFLGTTLLWNTYQRLLLKS